MILNIFSKVSNTHAIWVPFVNEDAGLSRSRIRLLRFEVEFISIEANQVSVWKVNKTNQTVLVQIH